MQLSMPARVCDYTKDGWSSRPIPQPGSMYRQLCWLENPSHLSQKGTLHTMACVWAIEKLVHVAIPFSLEQGMSHGDVVEYRIIFVYHMLSIDSKEFRSKDLSFLDRRTVLEEYNGSWTRKALMLF